MAKLVRSLIGLLLLNPVLGCSSAIALRGAQSEIGEASRLVAEGCYACLQEAKAKLLRAAPRMRGAVVEPLFEVHLLLFLRERELGLDWQPSLAEARALVPQLRPRVAGEEIVKLATAVPVDDAGWPAAERTEFFSRQRELRQNLQSTLRWLTINPVPETLRTYLSESLRCNYSPSRSSDDGPAIPPGSATIVRYRAAWCSSVDTQSLSEIRQRSPRFAEAAFVLAKHEMRLPQGLRIQHAVQLLDEALQTFPDSISINYLSGQARQVAGDCRGALHFFDTAIALKPLHERAMLARTICLSYLGEHRAAIDTATTLLQSSPPNAGDAYYWRAWNYHRLRELQFATSDVGRAKALVYNEGVLTLSGIVHYDSGRVDDARRDLASARGASPADRNCLAIWYLGLVELNREMWLASGKNFGDAASCYHKNVSETEEHLEALRRLPGLDESFRAVQTAALQAALTEDKSQESAAAYNAALQYYRGGDLAGAMIFLEMADRDASRADQVGNLRKRIRQP
jgi:tetratricopeptide (TPR) repeat protein